MERKLEEVTDPFAKLQTFMPVTLKRIFSGGHVYLLFIYLFVYFVFILVGQVAQSV